MQNLEALVLRTTPSTFIIRGIDYGKFLPYERVVGIEHGSRAWWLDPNKIKGDPSAGYDKAETAVAELEVPNHFALRATSFFARYMARDFEGVESHNCHRFAYWMSDSPQALMAPAVEEPEDFVFEGIEIESPLPLGAHGVIGSKSFSTRNNPARHSIVGSGDPSRCLEVVATGGYMALDSYENVLNQYGCNEPNGMRLYVPNYAAAS